MTTLAQLADRVQIALRDSGGDPWWDQTTVESWVVDAIRSYSLYFPRVVTDSTTISEDSPGHEFDLPNDFQEMVLVEFPTGEDPPAYLTRRARTHDNFYDQEGYYDVEKRSDVANADTLFLSEEPANGESFEITFLARHDITVGSSDSLTVPPEHEHLLILFCVWTAFRQQLANEIQNPDTTMNLVQQMTNAVEDAENEYRRALSIARNAQADGHWTGPWRSDIHDPIY